MSDFKQALLGKGKVAGGKLPQSTGFFLLAILVAIISGSVAHGQQQVLELIRKVEQSSGPARELAIIEVLKNYKAFSAAVLTSNSPIARETALLIDSKRFEMINKVWSQLGKTLNIQAVAPVGSAAAIDFQNAAGYLRQAAGREGFRFVVAKSDVDMIPIGPDAEEAVGWFRRQFAEMYGIEPQLLKIEVLSPTNVKDWPSRVQAVSNLEKYNTIGGNVAIQQYLYDGTIVRDSAGKVINEIPGNVLVVNRQTGQLQTQGIRQWMGSRPELKPEHAAGFFSDNTRFRNEAQELLTAGKPEQLFENLRTVVLKEAKYDVRNSVALGLIRDLSDDEKRLVAAAELAQTSAEAGVRKLLGLADSVPVSAVHIQQYLGQLDQFTQRAGREIVDHHLTNLIRNPSGRMTQELVGALANLPENQVQDIYRTLRTDPANVGKLTVLNECMVAARSLRSDVQKELVRQGARTRFIADHFDEAARRMFPGVKNYAALTPEQRLALHGAAEDAISSGQKLKSFLGKSLAAGFIAWAAYETYQSQGKGNYGAAAAGGRVIIDLLQMGLPPMAAGEIAGRLAVWGVKLGIEDHKNYHLESLYQSFKNSEQQDVNVALNQTIYHFMYDPGTKAGAYRQFRIENQRRIEAELGRELTSEELDQHIEAELGKLLLTRKNLEEATTAFENFRAEARVVCRSRKISLTGSKTGSAAVNENDAIEKNDPAEHTRLLQVLLHQFQTIENMVAEVGARPLSKDKVWQLLSLWRSEELEKFAEWFFIYTGKLAPPEFRQAIIDRFLKKHGGLGVFIKAPPAASIESQNPDLTSRDVWSGKGSWVHHTPADALAGRKGNKALTIGPLPVTAGKLKLKRTCSPPFEGNWSYFYNTHVAVDYRPRVVEQFGPKQRLILDDGSQATNQAEVAISSPGEIMITVSLCLGWGQYIDSWEQFAQDWSASLIMEPAASQPIAGSTIGSGDQVRIDSDGGVIQLPDGRFLIPKAGSEFSISNDKPGKLTVKFLNGSGRVAKKSSPSGDPGKGVTVTPKAAFELVVGDKFFSPDGTDFAFTWDGANGSLTVIEGSGTLSDAGGRTKRIESKQRVDLITEEIQDAVDEIEQLSHEKPLQDFLSDDSPEPYGEKVSYGLTGDSLDSDDSGWQWVDPDGDARFRLVGDGLHMEVPEGKSLDDQRVTAPQLLHKLTGDFDLETTLHVPRGVTDTATVVPVVHAPGSGMGYIAGQAQPFGASANYFRFDPIMAESSGRSMMPIANPSYMYSGHEQTVEAPDEPVFVRFNRRGDTWRIAWSLDRLRWQLASRTSISVPDTVWIGWAFEHPGNNGRPGEPAAFSVGPARLMTAPYASLPIPAWDIIDYRGQPSAIEPQQATLSVDGKQPGHARALSGTALEFDADVTIAMDRLQWPLINNAYYRARIGLQVDNNNQVYVHVSQVGESKQESPQMHVDGNWTSGEAINPEEFSSQWRFVRQGERISVFRWVDNLWSEMARHDAELSGKLSPFVEIENSVEGTPPVPVSARFRIINNGPETPAISSPGSPPTADGPSADSPTPANQPGVLGNQDLDAVFTVSDEEFQTRFAGKSIRVTGNFHQLEHSSRRVVLEVGSARYVSGAQVRNGTPNAFENAASFSPAWVAGQIQSRRSLPSGDDNSSSQLILQAEGEFGILDAEAQSTMEDAQPGHSELAGPANTQPSNPPSTPSLLTAAAIEEARRKVSDRWQATPDPYSVEGWARSWHDPNFLLEVFPQIKLQAGYVLRAYLHRQDANGSGVVWAMPADAEYPEPKDCPILEHHFLQAPKPFDALPDTMEGIEGDGSASSYLAASILKRELMEFGSLWHGRDWGTHSVLGGSPFHAVDPNSPDSGTVTLDPRSKWTWRETEPSDYRPKVVIDKERVVVTFYTYTARSGVDKNAEPLAERIMKHTDVYRKGKYRSSSTTSVVGVGVRWLQF